MTGISWPPLRAAGKFCCIAVACHALLRDGPGVPPRDDVGPGSTVRACAAATFDQAFIRLLLERLEGWP